MTGLLIVEDDKSLRLTLGAALTREGYTVHTAADGVAALAAVGHQEIDVILLDRELPGVSGDAVCRALVAADHPARILMLTAAGTINDRVGGLDLGADDYLAKPFSYVELSARIRALIRRDRRDDGGSVFTAGDVTLDAARRLVDRGGRPLRLTSKEFDVLEQLMRAEGGFLSVDRLLSTAWEDPYDRTRGVVKVLIYGLRKKLGFPGVIGHEPGHGYRIEIRP